MFSVYKTVLFLSHKMQKGKFQEGKNTMFGFDSNLPFNFLNTYF